MTEKKTNIHSVPVEQLRYALDNVPAYVYIKNNESRYLYANKLTLKLFGCSEETLLELSDHDFFPPDTVTRLREVDLRVLNGECTEEEVIVDNADGSQTTYWEVKTPIKSDVNPHEIIGILGISTDITARKKLEQQLVQAASTDALTGLPNRRLFYDRLSHSILVNSRHSTYGAVIFIDLDRFKELNDTYGHRVGDQYLVEMAKRISNVVRQYDTVARIGGDEFIVLLEDLGLDEELAQSSAHAIAAKIDNAMSYNYEIAGSMYKGSASTGMALFSGSDRSAEEVIAEADKVMYSKKRSRV